MQGVDKGFLLYNGAQQMFGHDELVPVRLGLSLCGSECLVYEYRIFYIHIVSFFLFFGQRRVCRGSGLGVLLGVATTETDALQGFQ